MLHNEGSSDLKYDPQINDYVVWTTALGMIHEGWVYFKSTPLAHKRGWVTRIDYITIELGVKEKPNCTENDPHKYVHVLLLCYESQWHELRYVKRRKSQKDDSILPESNQHIYYSEPTQNTHKGQ